MEAYLREIFSSFQGEGIFIGYRQVFLRFAGCNLNCFYCDTERGECPSFCCLEEKEGSGYFKKLPNPFKYNDLLKAINNFPLNKHHSLSLTGGEPLLHGEFLKDFLPLIKEQGNIKIFLETNGTLPDYLEIILPYIDIIAMDFKLPSSLKGKNYLKRHLKFLKMSLQKEAFIKIILTEHSREEEIVEFLTATREISDSVPVVFQPMVNPGNAYSSLSPEKILNFQSLGLDYYPGIRVIPQAHKILKCM
ncbi:MAG: 7-carboxy-7-deazaguanine synthase QueE [Candidatus Syntrophonatronum acetioxidans]|uniref:7-carboxy-7-deazaguanine synthase n=1 Tax=Candidatus Syntrophonatronum acetioxidans TaxID=1795816 RepID=A0A424YFI5_9FIRM|nr:MAG: 7-carboxy-7-deazaguanine synthase QueE [Candidatus Syntrophonatronum acetioxidans]